MYSKPEIISAVKTAANSLLRIPNKLNCQLNNFFIYLIRKNYLPFILFFLNKYNLSIIFHLSNKEFTCLFDSKFDKNLFIKFVFKNKLSYRFFL